MINPLDDQLSTCLRWVWVIIIKLKSLYLKECH